MNIELVALRDVPANTLVSSIGAMAHFAGGFAGAGSGRRGSLAGSQTPKRKQPLAAPAAMERMAQESGAPDVEHVPPCSRRKRGQSAPE